MDEVKGQHGFANIIRHLVETASGLTGHKAGTVGTHIENDVRYLRFGTPWIQGAMNMAKPDKLEIEYIQQMMLWTLFKTQANHICQLGLGASALTRFCHKHFPEALVTAVEINQDVIDVCRKDFFLPENNNKLNVICENALDFVTNVQNHNTIDVLQVDLYDAQARGPALGSPQFYEGCANVLNDNGIMTINIFCDYPEHNDHLKRMEDVFEGVAWLPEVHDSNIVAIGFKQAPGLEFDALYQRAKEIENSLGLPADTWVDGLYKWMALD